MLQAPHQKLPTHPVNYLIQAAVYGREPGAGWKRAEKD